MSTKDSNPKDALGCKKPPLSTVSSAVLFEVGAAMLEGACKYGRHNYREVGVRSSVYYDATMRHLMAWWEGEDIDPDSGLPHVTKALASLAVLRDAQINEMVDDDRPPSLKPGWMAGVQERVTAILERYPEPVAPYTIDSTRTNPMEYEPPLIHVDSTDGQACFEPLKGEHVTQFEHANFIFSVCDGVPFCVVDRRGFPACVSNDYSLPVPHETEIIGRRAYLFREDLTEEEFRDIRDRIRQVLCR